MPLITFYPTKQHHQASGLAAMYWSHCSARSEMVPGNEKKVHLWWPPSHDDTSIFLHYQGRYLHCTAMRTGRIHIIKFVMRRGCVRQVASEEGKMAHSLQPCATYSIYRSLVFPIIGHHAAFPPLLLPASEPSSSSRVRIGLWLRSRGAMHHRIRHQEKLPPLFSNI